MIFSSENWSHAFLEGWARILAQPLVTVKRDHPPFLSLHHAHRGTRLYLVFPTSHRSLVCVAYNCCFRPKPTTQCCPFTGFCNWNIGLHKRPLSWRMQQVHWTKIWWRCCVTPAVENHIVFKCERLTKKKLKYLKMARTLINPCVSIKRKANVEKIYDLRHIEVHICGQQQHKGKAAEFEGQKWELVTLESFLLLVILTPKKQS